MDKNKIIKAVLATIVTIFLGAVGSGVWERILSPLLNYIANGTTSLISSISSSYSDYIFSRASDRILSTDNSTGVLLLIILCALFYLFFIAARQKRDNNIVDLFYVLIVQFFSGWSGLFLSGFFAVFFFFMVSTQTTSTQIARYSNKQMEIVRPYVGEEKYFRLKSDFLRMKSKIDFEHFLQNLYESAKDGSITIDKYDSNKIY